MTRCWKIWTIVTNSPPPPPAIIGGVHAAIDFQAGVGGGATGFGVYTRHVAETLRRLFPDDTFTLVAPSRAPLVSVPDRVAWEQFRLPARLARIRADLVHSPCLGPPLVHPGRLVVTLHDFIPQKTPRAFGRASGWYFTKLIPYLQRRADALIANSEATKREAVEVLKVAPEKITVVPMFASPSLTQAAGVAGVEQAPGLAGRYFLFVGTLEERKNPAGVILAYARLPEEVRAEAGLRMVGRRTDHTVDLTALVYRLGLASRVRFLDYVSDVELAREYSHALALVFLSRYEGFGIPPLEAMTLGVPAILSDIPAFNETFADASIQVPLGNEQAAADAMMKVCSDVETRIGLINRGKALAAKFGVERTARETMEVYRKVV